MSEAFQAGRAFRKSVSHSQKFPYFPFDEGNDNEWILPAVNVLESCMPDSVLVLCKINHPTVAHVSGNSEQVIGHSPQYLKGLSPEEYFGLIHPDDRVAVKRLYEKMELHTASQSYQPDVWKLEFHYRLRTKSGRYVSIQDCKSAFLHASNRYVHYSLLRVIREKQTESSPFLVFNQKQNSFFRRVGVYVPQRKASMSPTHQEFQILECLAEGMTAKEIAEKLSLSVSTIKNHKSNLFKKLNARSTMHALKSASMLKWI